LNPPDTIPRVHDLLRIDPAPFLAAHPTLRDAPYVVVRRSPQQDDLIPVGVRGPTRSGRWPILLPAHLILGITTPALLLTLPIPEGRALQLPALQTLVRLKDLWSALDLEWGPTGSVAFELLTGRETATLSSDLDIVLHAPQPVSHAAASSLLTLTEGLPAKLDIRVETLLGGFSLAEFVQGAEKILLRTASGESLTANPWSDGGRFELLAHS
jgi:phosphoribosyl-dephospho-CoA transferase